MYDKQTLLDLLDRLNNLHWSSLREFAYSEGLNLRQIETIYYLSRCNHYSDTPLALTEYLGLTKGTISQTILSLANKGFLKKIADQKDRRITHLLLTPKSIRLIEKCNEQSILSQAIDTLPEVANTITESLLTILAHMQRSQKSKSFGVCKTCSYFRINGLNNSHQCGLTKEPLNNPQSLKICREHLNVSSSD